MRADSKFALRVNGVLVCPLTERVSGVLPPERTHAVYRSDICQDATFLVTLARISTKMRVRCFSYIEYILL